MKEPKKVNYWTAALQSSLIPDLGQMLTSSASWSYDVDYSDRIVYKLTGASIPASAPTIKLKKWGEKVLEKEDWEENSWHLTESLWL